MAEADSKLARVQVLLDKAKGVCREYPRAHRIYDDMGFAKQLLLLKDTALKADAPALADQAIARLEKWVAA